MNDRITAKILWMLACLLVFVLAACATTAQPTQAVSADTAQATESPTFNLNVHRNFGYGGGKQIKGNFGMAVVGDTQRIASAIFRIDGQEMAVVTTAPFEISFETTDYPYGLHQLSVVVTDIDGTVYPSPAREFEFVTAEVEREAVVGIMLPTLLGVGGAVLAGVLIQFLVLKKKGVQPVEPGTPRKYGLRGGAICPRCKRPFVLNFLTVNLLTRVYARCTNCGKWSVVRFASLAELRAAEKAELELDKPQLEPSPKSEAGQLKEKLDDSKYLDH